MTYINLSQVPLYRDVNDVLDYLIDRNCKGVINDISGTNVEYELDDLIQVWGNIYEKLKYERTRANDQ